MSSKATKIEKSNAGDDSTPVVMSKAAVNAMSLPSAAGCDHISASNVNIANILNSTGPIVNAVLLKAGRAEQRKNLGFDDDAPNKEEGKGNDDDDLNSSIVDIQIDTTPKKQMVSKVLGGAFTFLGQYEDEGIVLMIRKDQQSLSDSNDDESTDRKDNPDKLRINYHKLQPPLDNVTVRGDILVLKVAAVEDEFDCESNMKEESKTTIDTKPNEEFFLNYTRDEYLKFSSRTDIKPPQPMVPTTSDDEAEECDDEASESEEDAGSEANDCMDDDDDDDGGFAELLMGQVLNKFQEENGRMPDEQELKALESAISEKLGGLVG